MRSLLVILSSVLVFACGTPRKTHPGAANPTTRAMHHSSSDSVSNDVIVTGSQYVPILGKSEAGTRPDIEGLWVLQSGIGANNSNNLVEGKSLAANENGKDYNGIIIGEPMKNTKEIRRDSTTRKTADGRTETSTTVYLINEDAGRGNKVTPPQSANPNVHVPEKPHLSFFGSNETFSGFTGCNKIAGRYKMKGNTISFHDATPSTKMVCIGAYDENEFLNALHRVNTFRTTNNTLELLDGNDVLMVFSRK